MRAKLHADDTPVPVLSPGKGTMKTGRLWVYVRDDRACADQTPPAVLFRYSPDRKAVYPHRHLRPFVGVLQADAYAGFNALYERPRDPLLEAACWAHARRKFYDIHEATGSPIAREAPERIAALYQIEEQVRGRGCFCSGTQAPTPSSFGPRSTINSGHGSGCIVCSTFFPRICVRSSLAT